MAAKSAPAQEKSDLREVPYVLVPTTDLNSAIAFCTRTLGLGLDTDWPHGDGQRWVEVAPGGGADVALTR